MKQIYVKTTESCNLKCEHCYVQARCNTSQFFNSKETSNWIKKYLQFYNLEEKDLLISFHGGEPFLDDPQKLLDFKKNFPLAVFNATSNLCLELTEKHLELIKSFYDPLFNKPLLKTSWDYKIRFNSEQEQIWRSNVKKLLDCGVIIQTIVCLTKQLIEEVKASDLIYMFKFLKIQKVDFERITVHKAEHNLLVPDYKKQDKWLLEAFQASKEAGLEVCMFESLRESIKGNHSGCRKRQCMQEVITINANGSIGGCPNTALIQPYASIYEDIQEYDSNLCRTCLIKKEQQQKIQCLRCKLFNICNGDCHQLCWQGDECPAPTLVMEELLNES